MKTELSLSDEWETPQNLFNHLCIKYDIIPELDVCSKNNNLVFPVCYDGIKIDGLIVDWLEDAWCNPPHSKNEEFVKKAHEQWKKHNINIMMILPANSLCTNYAEKLIHPYAEYHPINRKFCKFLHDGKKKDSSRNGYFVVIWRKI